MGFLKNFFAHKDDSQKELAKLKRQIDSFMRPSRGLLGERLLKVPEMRQRYALFALGAIKALIKEPDPDDTRALAVLVMHLKDVEEMHEHEASRLVNVAMEQQWLEAEQALIAAAAGAITDWLGDNAGEAVTVLSQHLKDDSIRPF